MEANINDERLIEVIQDAVTTNIITVDEQEYLTREVFDPPEPELAKTLQVHTLQGVVDYIKHDPKLDKEIEDDDSGLAVHVLSQDTVRVIGPLIGRARKREILIEAQCYDVLGGTFKFGTYYETEHFLILLRSLFA